MYLKVKSLRYDPHQPFKDEESDEDLDYSIIEFDQRLYKYINKALTQN